MYADFNIDAESALIRDFASHNTWFTGADESVFSKYRNTLIIYAFLVILLLYMAMGAQFESFLLPLILMMSIPFSLAGAGPALLLGGAKIDSGVIFGLTALFGLVVNNSLLLFEISEQKINSGFSPAAAVYKGAKERLRAILITMITTVIALLPLVIVLSAIRRSQWQSRCWEEYALQHCSVCSRFLLFLYGISRMFIIKNHFHCCA